MSEALSVGAAAQLVPAGYAEKAMASLMQLHSELMDEKERRVDLFRRLMEREQALAELKMYVKVLEERMTPAAAGAPPPEITRVKEPVSTVSASTPPRVPSQVPPVPPRVSMRARVDGWKTW